jgi:ArsR family transcriptional regulator
MILDLLKTGEKTVSELAQLIVKSQSNISQHLAVLRQRGVITARKEGANTYYRVASDRFVEICNLIRRALYEVLREGEEIAKKLEEIAPAR